MSTTARKTANVILLILVATAVFWLSQIPPSGAVLAGPPVTPTPENAVPGEPPLAPAAPAAPPSEIHTWSDLEKQLDKGPVSEIMFRRQIYSDRDLIQTLLAKLGSPLAQYRTKVDGREVTAADLIVEASLPGRNWFAPEILMTYLEWRWGLLSPSSKSAAEIDALMDAAPDGSKSLASHLQWAGDNIWKTYASTSDAAKASATLRQFLGAVPGVGKQGDPLDKYLESYGRFFGESGKQDAITATDRSPIFRKPLDRHYLITSFLDHGATAWCDRDGWLRRIDGRNFQNSLSVGCARNCDLGLSCYDGHDGIDYDVPDGAHVPVRAAAAGTIVTADNRGDSCGLIRVYVTHSNGFRSQYLHLSKISEKRDSNPPRKWQAGDEVREGDELGLTGDTGCNSSGEHLHFALIETSTGAMTDPYGNIGATRQNSLFRSSTRVQETDTGFQRFDNDDWWKVAPAGDGGSSLYTFSGPATYRNWALWGADIPTTGRYEVFAFVPNESGVATSDMASDVTYRIMHSSDVAEVVRDQRSYRGQWMSLGTYTFDAHSAATVMLSDKSSGSRGKRIYFDTVEWRSVSAGPPAPRAEFDASPLAGDAPLTVRFHNTSSGNYSSCAWDYGDGATGTGCAAYHDHVYNRPGTHTVKLTVSGPGGNSTRTRDAYVTVRGPVAGTELIVDDRDPGFSRSGPFFGWRESSMGYRQHSYWTYATTIWYGSWINNVATWRPTLPAAGRWEVFAYIAPVYTGVRDTSLAHYQVWAADGRHVATRDQTSGSGWVSLGEYNFNAGSQGYVRLEDVTADAYYYSGIWQYWKSIKFDAMRWVYKPTSSSVGAIGGRVVNATTNQPIASATVSVEGTTLSATTNSDGYYTLQNVPSGQRRVSASRAGYITQGQDFPVVANQTGTLNFALSPSLAAGEMRIVLQWGGYPRDADSHLWLPSSQPYHIYYRATGNLNGFPYAALDIDDMDGYGPETITLRQRVPGRYVYAVYNYSISPALSTSGARVAVYAGSSQVASFGMCQAR